MAAKAPINDLAAIKQMKAYFKIDPEVSDVVLNSLLKLKFSVNILLYSQLLMSMIRRMK